jgi:putative nucleotidyltransferase with HDIG domain
VFGCTIALKGQTMPHPRDKIAIPSKKACYGMIREMKMMAHIVRHSLQVCRVAMLLAEALQNRGVELNLDLIQAAALLHDITKTRSFETGEKHTDTGCKYLTACGYPHVGDIVRQHVELDDYFESGSPGEAEIVNYADKRVLHDRIVSLAERMNYILRRYATSPIAVQCLEGLWEKTLVQEERIFSDLSFDPEQLEQYLQNVDLAAELRIVFDD